MWQRIMGWSQSEQWEAGDLMGGAGQVELAGIRGQVSVAGSEMKRQLWKTRQNESMSERLHVM